MRDIDQTSESSTVADPVGSVASGVSLLDSILLLLTPEQQEHFLTAAGLEGVVYANRAPTFDKPLALKIVPSRFRDLLKLIGRPAREVSPRQWECDYDDPEPLAILREDLEAGVRVSPPPRDWFRNHPDGDDVPIRIESKRFGIPCRVRPHVYGGSAYLEATALEPSAFSGSSEPSSVEDFEFSDEMPPDSFDVENLSPARGRVTVDCSASSALEFTPHFVTTWEVLGPKSRLSPEFDRNALERFVSQLVANGLHSAISRATCERCDMLKGLVRVKQFAGQYPYTLASQSGETFELQVQGPGEALAAMESVFVYEDATDGSGRIQVRGVRLDRVGQNGQRQVYRLFRSLDGLFVSDPPPASGYLSDTGDVSQLRKQLDALRELRHPSSRPHLLRLGTLIGKNGGLTEPVDWEAAPIRLVDDKLTERQSEAVRKALATPDICLIQGPPGTGKTRVISEVVEQAARRNWKVLLVAPTHVAVHNVLERIGLKDDVSPVLCASEEKRKELSEHLRQFTYENRSDLLARETGRRSEVDLCTWHSRTKRFESALADLQRCAAIQNTAAQTEREASELRRAHRWAPQQVLSEFNREVTQAADAERSAIESRSAWERALEARRRELGLSDHRVAALTARQFSAEDQQRLDQAEAAVGEEHASRIEAAASVRDRTSATIDEITGVEAEKQRSLTTALEILALLDRTEVPSTVQGVVDAAVAETTKEHDKFVVIRSADVENAKREYADAQDRIAELEQKAADANAHVRSLKEAQAKPLPLRLISRSWWRSFFVDDEQRALEASRQSTDLQQQRPTLETRIQDDERSLQEAQARRLEAIEATRSQALAQQRESFREAASRLPVELEAIHSDHIALTEQLRSQEGELNGLQEACRQEVEKARETTHAAMLAAARAELDAASSALGSAEARLSEVQQRSEAAKAQVRLVTDRVRHATESRMQELARDIEGKERELAVVRERYAPIVASLTDVLPTPPAFDASRIDSALRQLTTEHEGARRRLALLEEWTRYLSREAGTLKDRLAQYVNLVCATTVGIATDEYFGDRGAFVEKQFDLLVVDEAGKVTEPEFLVAAARAKRWVLVGDHKQLPPYYDQILDPYLHSANASRKEAGQPPLDAQALRLSIFERLWCRLNPVQPSADAESPRIGASRCVTLDVQRRMHPDLAGFVSDMFYGGRYYSPDGEAYRESKTLDLTHFPKPVTFIDISAGRGADGYEVDLSKLDQRTTHLAEHEADLPVRGYANLKEAEQVIHVLEEITNDAALQREHAELEQVGDQVPLVGIIALYAGQVALIHRLIRSNGTLQGERVSESDWLCRGMRISVNSVDAFQGKECPVIILSFTRSNRRRAVGFVDDPNRLNVALSRARKKLILVGDSETLTRRAREQVDGSKNSRAASTERDFFVQLILYVEGRGNTMRVFERRSVS